MNLHENTNLPALEFFRLDQPCSNDTTLPQGEQLSSLIDLAKKDLRDQKLAFQLLLYSAISYCTKL